MKTCRKIMALLIALSTVMSYATGVLAEETQLKTWHFINDWLTVGRPLGDSHKDTYGNENVWSVRAYKGDYKQSSEINPNSIVREKDGLCAWYWGNYQSTNLDLLGADGMVRLNDSGTTLYARTLHGCNHAYTWTAPESIVADVTVSATRVNNSGWTYFDLYQNDIKVQTLFTVYNPTESGTKTTRIAVKKGDRITVAVHGTNADNTQIRSEYNFPTFEIKEVAAASTALQSWDYRKDAFASGDKSGVFGDTYGNHNTWGIYFGKTVDGTYKKEAGEYFSNTKYAVTDKDDRTTNLQDGTRIYFGNSDEIVLNETSYAQVKQGTDIYFVFRAPKDMYAKFDIKVQNRFGRAGQNVTVYNDSGDEIKTGVIGSAPGDVLNFTEYAALKTGETVEIKIDNSNTCTTTVNPYITVTEIYETYSPVIDYKGKGSPKQNTWGTLFSENSNWTLNYTMQDGTTAVPTTTDGETFALADGINTFNHGKIWGAESFADTAWYYMNIKTTDTSISAPKSNLKWIAPKDGMVEITYKGSTRWNNGWDETTDSGKIHHPMHVGFGVEKNNARILYFESAGLINDNVGSKTRKIAVKQGDVINFTVASVQMANGEYASEDVVAYSDIKYIGEASGKLTFNAPTITTETAEGVTTVTATLTGSNQTGEKATAAIVLAGYSADGKLTNIKIEKLDDYEADFSKSVSFTKGDSDDTFRTFVWNSLEGMKPIETK